MNTGSEFGEFGGSRSPLGERYTLVKELGRGGFGQTYLAEDRDRDNELCVVKEFVPQVEDKAMLAKAKTLFDREGRVLYQLGHKQIPEFRELLNVESETGGRLFLVQDYIAGPTYQSLLQERQRFGGQFTETEIRHLLYQLLPVLAYIHSLGIVHRDISPDNIILRQTDGLPVLIDFGSVKEIAATVRNQLSIKGLELAPTRIGKMGYVPPEQLSSGEANPTTDLYGLAATLLVLVTGKDPQVLNDPYHGTWSGYENLSPKLAQVLKKMLSAEPASRFQTAKAVLMSLEASSDEQSGTEHPADEYGSAMVPEMASEGALSDDLLASGTAFYSAESPVDSIGGSDRTDSSPTLNAPVMAAAGMAAGRTLDANTGQPIEAELSHADAHADTHAYGSGVPQTEYEMGLQAGLQTDYGESFLGEESESKTIGKPGNLQIILASLAMLGLLGALLFWAVPLINNSSANRATNRDAAGSTVQPIADGEFTPEETARKAEILQRQQRLGISDRTFTGIVNQLFYEEYQTLLTSGENGGKQPLTAAAADEPLRLRWDHIALDLLNKLENNFSEGSLRALGSYSEESRTNWRSQLSASNVGDRALDDLIETKFFQLFPSQSGRDFLTQPIGQLYYALGEDTVRAIESGAVSQTVEFTSGAFSKDVTGQLKPGAGQIYTLRLSAGQLFRLSLTAPAESTLLSLYLPEPTSDSPYILADSEQTVWSGAVSQTGVYEVAVVNRSATTINYQMTLSVDKVTTAPVAPPPKAEENLGSSTNAPAALEFNSDANRTAPPPASTTGTTPSSPQPSP